MELKMVQATNVFVELETHAEAIMQYTPKRKNNLIY